jgi:hypothetical protein
VTGVRVDAGAVASVRRRTGSEVTGDMFARWTPFAVTRQWGKDAHYA